ncbi:MAG: hypothetical protein ACFFD4_22705 [Candidatus Odinarchaeota archaeon]
MLSYFEDIKRFLPPSSKMVEIGAKILILDNLGWIIMPFMIIGYFIVFSYISIIENLAPLVVLVVLLVFSTADIIGFGILGSGLLYYDQKTRLARISGVLFLIWSALTILWRLLLLFAFSHTYQSTFTEEEKYSFYGILRLVYVAGCLALFVGAFYLARYFNSLIFLVYAIFNMIFAYVVAPMFVFVTDETAVLLESLALINVVLKMIFIPAIGILSFRSVLPDISDNYSGSSKTSDFRASTIDIDVKKAHITQWEGFRAVMTTKKEQVIAVIECPKCNEKYPKETIHTNCLYCGEKLPIQTVK